MSCASTRQADLPEDEPRPHTPRSNPPSTPQETVCLLRPGPTATAGLCIRPQLWAREPALQQVPTYLPQVRGSRPRQLCAAIYAPMRKVMLVQAAELSTPLFQTQDNHRILTPTWQIPESHHLDKNHTKDPKGNRPNGLPQN